jgi:hypothetical protein
LKLSKLFAFLKFDVSLPGLLFPHPAEVRRQEGGGGGERLPVRRIRDQSTDDGGEEEEDVLNEEDPAPDILRHARGEDMLAIGGHSCGGGSIGDDKEGREDLHHLPARVSGGWDGAGRGHRTCSVVKAKMKELVMMESQAMPTKTIDQVPISETCSGKGRRTTQHNLNMSAGGRGGGD